MPLPLYVLHKKGEVFLKKVRSVRSGSRGHKKIYVFTTEDMAKREAKRHKGTKVAVYTCILEEV